MKTETVTTKIYEFCFPELDTLVQVENWNNRVIIRATRDSFSDERRTCFVRELAAEGFIPDDYRWFSAGSYFSRWPVRWLVDFTWLKLDPQMLAQTDRFMARLFAGVVLLWFVLMTTLFLNEAHGGLCHTRPAASVLSTHG